MADEGIVYILSNEAMPGLIKIGLTKRDGLEARLNELYSTGVPLPFTCEYACRVKDCKAVENALHTAFTKDRINPAREFFRTSVITFASPISLIRESQQPKIASDSPLVLSKYIKSSSYL